MFLPGLCSSRVSERVQSFVCGQHLVGGGGIGMHLGRHHSCALSALCLLHGRYNRAVDHMSFTPEQMELLSLQFVFRGRTLNYNGIRFIEQFAGKAPVTIVHVQLNFNEERVRMWGQCASTQWIFCIALPCVAFALVVQCMCRVHA